MPFFLDGEPTSSEISEAVNYLLSNFQQTSSSDNVTGQVTDSTGAVISYLYKYLYVKYADSFDGTVNFSNTPTGRSYYGLRNNDSQTESTNPADYIWYQVTGGFGSTKFVFYSVTGGRRINIVVGLSAPSILYQADSGSAIDLDRISGSDGSSSRICYAKSTSFTLASTPSTYQTSGPSGFPPTNTWGGSETWQATPPTLATNEALFQSDGIYNPVTDLTTWNVPYLSNLKVGSLSAISANLGSITAGSLNAVTITGSDLTIGSSPAISGNTMSGSGSRVYNDGKFALGNSTGNIVFNGTNVYINGFINNATTASFDTSLTSSYINAITFTVTKAGPVFVNLNGVLSGVSTNTSVVGMKIIANIILFNSSNVNVAQIPVEVAGAVYPTLSLREIAGQASFVKIVNLPIDTYILKINLNSATATDSSGNVIASAIYNVGFTGAIGNSFQVLA